MSDRHSFKTLKLSPKELLDVHVIKSDLYALNSNWLLSQIELENALEIQADDELKLRRALVMAQRGQYSSAEEEIKQLIYSTESKDIEAYLALGEIQALQNKAHESIATYKQVLSFDSNNYKALIFLGAIYSQLNNIQAAQYYFARLKKIPEYRHLGFYYLGRLHQQTKDYNRSIAEFRGCTRVKDDFSDCQFSLADSYILNSEQDKAIAVLERHKENSPESERSYAKLYDLYTEAQDAEKAFNQLAFLERFEPQNTYIKLQMAMYFLVKQDIVAAESKLLEILEISPEFERAHFLLTSIFAKEKNLETTQKYYQALKESSPYFIDATLLVARLMEELSGMPATLGFINSKNKNIQDSRLGIYQAILNSKLEKPQQSIRILEKVVKKDGKNIQALYYLGHLQGENGIHDRAVVNMRRVLMNDPNHVDALNYLAYFFAEQKIQLDEALSMAQKAHELRPDDGHILDTLGWIYFQLGEYNKAESYLEKAYVLHPDETVIAEHLAQVYSSKGFSEKALQVYNKLLQQGVVDREKILRYINSIQKPSRATSSSK